MATVKINKKNFLICFIFFSFFFLTQSNQSNQCFFYYIFMAFPVCQNKIKECMEFLCKNNNQDIKFIKECEQFYNKYAIKYGLK